MNDKKPPLGPIPTINAEEWARHHDAWIAAGEPITTPENDPDPTEV